jgi:dihydropteroate synthase
MLAGVEVGDGLPVAVMGALNVSPESFHRGSVHTADDALLRAAEAMVEAGAVILDVGARSTAPYLATEIDEEEERDRLGHAVALLAAKIPVPLSADTARPAPARAALEAGARILNDVTALADPAIAALAGAHGAGLILMASPAAARSDDWTTGPPLAAVRTILASGLARARAAGIPDSRLVLDPGVGFFRGGRTAWVDWDVAVLAGLAALADLGRPLGVGVSRKSFLGALTGRATPGERLAASLAATAVAVLHGAALVRTHDVAETRDAVRVAERLRG